MPASRRRTAVRVRCSYPYCPAARGAAGGYAAACGFGGTTGSHPRPADVFLPSFRRGTPAALDFAVTSGLKSGALFSSAADGASAAAEYEARKRAHLDTAAHCKDEGILFIPMVMEACGGAWGPAARSV
eukprot:gene19577-biopygen5141